MPNEDVDEDLCVGATLECVYAAAIITSTDNDLSQPFKGPLCARMITTPGPFVMSLNHLRDHWLLAQECLSHPLVQAQVCAIGWTGFGLAASPA